jgi:DNA-binding NarL/FixJ family response regulator
MITSYILLVEDDVHFAAWAAAELRQACQDLAVFVAHDMPAARGWLEGADGAGLQLAVVDLHLGPHSGVELIETLTQHRPDVPVLVLTSVETPDEALRAIRAGAQGYMLKVTVEGELCRAVQQIRNGGSPINPGIAHLLLTAFRAAPLKVSEATDVAQPVSTGMLSVLSGRESEVLKLVARGYSDKEVAVRLHIAPSTVDTHIRAIYRKLRVNSRAQLRKVLEP